MEDNKPTSNEGEKQPQESSKGDDGAVQEPVEGAGDKEPTTPPAPSERTYSTEEWGKRQSSWDKAKAEMEKLHKEETDQLRAKVQEQARKDFLKVAEEAGEDTDVAGKFFDEKQAIINQEQEVKMGLQLLSVGTKQSDIEKFVKTYNLDESAKEELSKAKDPDQMKTVALTLALSKSLAEKSPPVKTDPGVGTTKGVDLSKATPGETIRWALEHEGK